MKEYFMMMNPMRLRFGIVLKPFLLAIAFLAWAGNSQAQFSYQILYSFGTNAWTPHNPNTGLTQGADGNLYGATAVSFYYDQAKIFRISPNGELTNLPSFFSGSFSYSTASRLIQSSDGNLYGMITLPYQALGDSVPMQGAIYKVTADGSVSALAAFWGTNNTGAQPVGALLQTSDGTLWGTTYTGGVAGPGSVFGFGTVFQFRTDGIFSGLLSFPLSQTTGYGPKGGLVGASDGNLYGTTTDTTRIGSPSPRAGSIFRISAQGLTTLLTFYGTNGAYPTGSLLAAQDGALYGTTSFGGASSNGTVFRITTSGVFTSLFSFGSTNGANPTGDLIQLNDGNLYGTTSYGGTNNSGTIFRITTNGALTTIFRFNSYYTGGSPLGGLCLARDGNLYGTTSKGGPGAPPGYPDGGTIFRLVPSPVITSATQSNGGVVLNWSSFTDAVYRVEYRTNVNSGSWLTLATNIVSSGNAASFIDPAVGDVRRFYRVVLLPH